MEYSVYILYSESGNKYYVGSSRNPERRLEFHNTAKKGYTSRYRLWKIVFQKEFPDKQTAQQIERKIKKYKSRVMVERIINGLMEL